MDYLKLEICNYFDFLYKSKSLLGILYLVVNRFDK